jgi:gliding motility-associated-like protein
VGKKSYASAGTYKDTLINFLGCDSFVYSKFNIAQDTVYLKDHVCNTFIYQVGDSTFYKPGLYSVTMMGSSGCDSVVIADISMSRDTAVRIRPNICQGDSFMLLGLRYALPGNYEAQLPRFDGCDSIIRLTLNVRSHYQISQEINICSGDSASVGNRIYKTSGLFIDTLKSRWGCDSIIESKVNVNPKYDTAVVYILCGDSSVVINQNTYRDAQEFSFKYRSQLGCDSLVFYRILKTKLQAELDLDTSQLPLFTVQNLSSDAIKFLWDFEDAFYDSTRNTIRYQFNDIEKTYRVCLSVTDSLGCVDSSCVVIPASFVKFELYNSFSPNDDGFNDRFVVKSNGRDLQYSLMIFNRWGAKVYQTEKAWTNNPDLYWNGRVMNTGPECPSGSYFVLYNLYLDGPDKDPKMINGVITVVR